MRAMSLALPLLLLACSGGGDDKTTADGTDTSPSGDDDDVTSSGDDDDDTAGDDDDDDDDDDDTTGTHACHDGPLELSVGTGAIMFEPLSTGSPVTIVHGPQGGWHIDIAGEVTGTTDIVEVASVITLASSGDAIAGDQQPTRIALSDWDDAGCTGNFFGITTYVDDIPSTDQQAICDMEGETLTIELTVTDLSAPSITITEVLDVTMALDAIDVKPCSTM